MIINITGGPDLSLVEVSEASSIVQEAADEDANIIFGAVVDPQLKGKVKITVIATGFGPQAVARPNASVAPTPVDMTQYDGARRAEHAAANPASIPVSRLTMARRSLLDLPLAAAAPAQPGAAPAANDRADDMRKRDDDLSITFDVPAFLRRQEG